MYLLHKIQCSFSWVDKKVKLRKRWEASGACHCMAQERGSKSLLSLSRLFTLLSQGPPCIKLGWALSDSSGTLGICARCIWACMLMWEVRAEPGAAISSQFIDVYVEAPNLKAETKESSKHKCYLLFITLFTSIISFLSRIFKNIRTNWRWSKK